MREKESALTRHLAEIMGTVEQLQAAARQEDTEAARLHQKLHGQVARASRLLCAQDGAATEAESGGAGQEEPRFTCEDPALDGDAMMEEGDSAATAWGTPPQSEAPTLPEDIDEVQSVASAGGDSGTASAPSSPEDAQAAEGQQTEQGSSPMHGYALQPRHVSRARRARRSPQSTWSPYAGGSVSVVCVPATATSRDGCPTSGTPRQGRFWASPRSAPSRSGLANMVAVGAARVAQRGGGAVCARRAARYEHRRHHPRWRRRACPLSSTSCSAHST
jgi:hypothetical protein